MPNFQGLIALLVVGLAINTSEAQEEDTQQHLIGNAKYTSAVFNYMRSEHGNQLISPLNLEILLVMAFIGARGQTASQIRKAANALDDHYPLQPILKGRKPWLDHAIFGDNGLSIKEDYLDLGLIHSIWTYRDLTIKPQFRHLFEDFLNAEMVRLYAVKQKAIPDVESENTGNANMDMDSQDQDDFSKLILLNKAYFTVNLAKEFPESVTYKDIFRLNERDEKEVDFIQIQRNFNITYNFDLQARILEIPFKDNNVNMILVVPYYVNGLADLESKLASYDFKQLTTQGYSSTYFVSMPKLKLEKRLDLKSLLVEKGVADLFDPSKADLSRIADDKLYVSEVVQDMYFEVTDEGRERLDLDFNGKSDKRTFFVDRPFLFLLKHVPTGSCFTIGRVTSP